MYFKLNHKILNGWRLPVLHFFCHHYKIALDAHLKVPSTNNKDAIRPIAMCVGKFSLILIGYSIRDVNTEVNQR